ncbi:hypothetical protein [Acrocarpospora sp. B8E8]|uniref:hypothetical protein n=1 Tax=Acrocarpospora sp. B8E8 TaxID=3153572 RepID=UPI00325EA828
MRRIALTAALLALTLAGCSDDQPLTVKGAITVTNTAGGGWDSPSGVCQLSDGYNDINEGAQVVVSDASAKTLAIGRLGRGNLTEPFSCSFSFTVSGVPAGEKSYGVEVSHRGRIQYPAAELAQPLALTLGS